MIKALGRLYKYGMGIGWESILGYIAAVAVAAVIVWVMHLKTRGVLRVIINSIAGAALIAGLSAFNVIALPLNLFTACLIGVLGVPGALIVIAAAFLL